MIFYIASEDRQMLPNCRSHKHMKSLNQSISLSYIYSLSSSRPGVDELSVVVDNSLDKTLLLKESDGTSGEGTVDLHSVDEDRLRNKLVGGDLLDNSVIDSLVNDDGVVGLVLHLALAPLLLLTGLGTGHSGGGLLGLGLNLGRHFWA